MENVVPWLRSGVGKTPKDGGCIMQVVDWIHRNKWTDSPPCVHPAIRALAVRANDRLGDEGRQRLLDLVPRMMGTASDDKELSVRLALFCAKRVLPIFEAKYPQDGRPRRAIEATEAWLANPCDETLDRARYAYAYAAHVADAAASAYAAADAADLSFLTDLLNEYDRLVGPRQTCEIDYRPVVEAMHAA